MTINNRDTPLSGATRFLSELLAWVSIPWAAAVAGGVVLAVPVAPIVIGLPAIFSTPGDKKTVIVAVAGPLRLVLELLLLALGVTCAWIVWPVWASVAATLLVAVTLVANLPRYRWLVTQTGLRDERESL